MRKEHQLAENLDEHKKNPNFGFKCLHYSVSEGSGFIEVVILNKTKKAGKIGARTVDGDAKDGEDYNGID